MEKLFSTSKTGLFHKEQLKTLKMLQKQVSVAPPPPVLDPWPLLCPVFKLNGQNSVQAGSSKYKHEMSPSPSLWGALQSHSGVRAPHPLGKVKGQFLVTRLCCPTPVAKPPAEIPGPPHRQEAEFTLAPISIPSSILSSAHSSADGSAGPQAAGVPTVPDYHSVHNPLRDSHTP